MRAVRSLVLLALAAGIASAQGQPAPGKVDQKDVDAAIDKGANYLAKQSGSWLNGTEPHFELVMYTLFHSGTYPRDSKVFLDGVALMKTKKLEKTYNVALTAMFLESYDRVANQKRIRDCGQFLVDNQCENGQWSYGEPIDLGDGGKPDDGPVVNSGGGSSAGGGTSRGPGSRAGQRIILKRNRRGPPTGDHSNTQYAILGLRSVAAAEVIPPKETWEDALKILEEAQDNEGSWSYSYQNSAGGADPKKGGPKVIITKNPGYGSMTCGCVGSLVICKYYLRAHYGKNEDYKKDKRVLDGLKWIADHFTVEENANYEKVKATASIPTGDKYTWHYYYLYALERAGMLGDWANFGKYDWYEIGARWLLANQNPDGSWKGKHGNDTYADTCFAILFLRRATKPVAPVVRSGR